MVLDASVSCLALCVCLAGMMPWGLVLPRFCVRCLCVLCFVWICVRIGFVACGFLWFGGSRAEWVGDRLNIVFRCDVILCG